MKRSEMKELVKNKLLDLYMLDFSTEERAEFLLKAIEEAGMLPPLNENWMSLDECKEFYGPSWENDVSTYPRKNVHRWEPEDG